MNLRELFSNYPLDCESFNAEWLRRWSEVGRLLEARASIRCAFHHGWEYREFEGSVGACVEHVIQKMPFAYREREPLHTQIVLLDGTIVREWGAT